MAGDVHISSWDANSNGNIKKYYEIQEIINEDCNSLISPDERKSAEDLIRKNEDIASGDSLATSEVTQGTVEAWLAHYQQLVEVSYKEKGYQKIYWASVSCKT